MDENVGVEVDEEFDECEGENQVVKGLPKKQVLNLWQNLPVTDPATVVKPIPYKHTGAKFAEDSIRITGSCEFINAVLSNLKSMIKLDSKFNKTRLQPTYMPTEDRESGLPSGSWVAYIQVHARGEGKRGRKKKKYHW